MTQCPALFPSDKLSLYHYLLLGDALRRWNTEGSFLRRYGIELSLVAPSLAHRSDAQAVWARKEEKKREEERGRSERFLAGAVAQNAAAEKKERARAAVNGSSSSGDEDAAVISPPDFFAHPFLSSTSLTPRLLSTLLSHTQSSVLSRSTALDNDVACRRAEAGSIARGRIDLKKEDLQTGYAQMIATGNFD